MKARKSEIQAIYLTAHNNMASSFYSVLYYIPYTPIACNFTFILGILRKYAMLWGEFFHFTTWHKNILIAS